MSRRRIALIALAALTSPSALAAQPFRVVIDPGHGGQDTGALADVGGIQVAEKDLTLALALETQRHLKLKGIQVTLTRTTDHDVPLSARTALANRLKADLFLSIHMNSTPSGGAPIVAHGVETYILNNTSNESSQRLAYLENTANRPNLPSAGGDTPDVALILKDLTLDANLSESKRLACGLQHHLVLATGGDRGVKQALFHVLLGADMPSALIEAGFMSSQMDRKRVLTPLTRMKMGIAMARAIDQFRKDRGTPRAQSQLATCKVH